VGVSFRILGPLEVHNDGTQLPLGAGRQRALLALLLVHVNELVSSDRLIDEFWSGRPPASAQKVLQGYVSQLRRALGADAILTRGSGYQLIEPDTDAKEFERLTRIAAEQDAEDATLTLERALALWQGRAFEEFEYEDWATFEIARLEELRLAAIERRVEAELELGHHAEVVPELEKVVAEHPQRDRLRGQLMVALYRSGRHADALEVYRRGRQVLRDELGLEPSPFLAELERQILTHDGTLRASAHRGLPAGTVTFLFTDIEGSTRLLRQLGDGYGDVLEEHQRILRDAVARYEGREVDTQGDSFLFAFARAKSALAAAVIAQGALAQHQGPEGAQVRVRMGLHTAEPAVGEERYVGLGVHKAARIGSAGHGGQVLLSNTTRELVEETVGDVTVRALGTYRLKDMDQPEALFQLDIEGLPTKFPPLKAEQASTPRPQRRRLVLAGSALAIVGIAAMAIAFIAGGGKPDKPLPDSLVRIDPKTLKATEMAQVGDAPDLVIASGGYIWVTNDILRDSPDPHIKNGGDRTLIRVDPSNGDAVVVGGGLAPCGLTADPSGDVWVVNCYPPKTGAQDTVVRIDAKTLDFTTWRVPGGPGFFRGRAYGGGSLWVSGGGQHGRLLTQVDPETGAQQSTRLPQYAGGLAWSGGYGDLWATNFDHGTIMRSHGGTGAPETVDSGAVNPDSPVVDGDAVWVGDWSSPHVVRRPAVGAGPARSIRLPIHNTAACPKISCVWVVAAGAGAIWATTPEDHALWRINPTTDAVTRIPLAYPPTGVAADATDVWVTVRG
jgi:DNA-binding SARP family transcriptional activator/streptogramin lyase